MSEKTKVTILEVEETSETLKLVTLNEDGTAVFEVSLGKMKYNKEAKVWSDDPETYEKYVENLAEFLQLAPDDDKEVLVGREIEVFQRSETKVSFFDGITIDKPANELIGELEKVPVEAVLVGDGRTTIVVKWTDGKLFGINFNYGNWIESIEKMLPNPAKRIKAEERFKKLTGKSFDNAQDLVGEEITVEIKENGLNPTGDGYCEMKKIKR